jgi:hypothetical protein
MKVFVAVLVLGVALTGCSSKSTPSPSQPTGPTSSYAFNGGAIAGFHGNVSKKTTTYKFSLIPRAYAQTTVVTLSGTYSGYAPLFQGAESQGQGIPIPQGSVPIAYPIYGVGTFSLSCGGGGTTGSCPYGVGGGSMDPGQALASQATPTAALSGSLAPGFVTGGGTLGPLVVYAYDLNGTLPVGSSTTSDLVEVWVIRNGQVINSGISCSLTVQNPATPQQLQQQRCESLSTFAVQDGDGIIATVTLNPADEVLALSFFLVKA